METAPSAGDNARKPRRNGRKILVAAGFLVLLGLGVLAYWFFFLRGIVYSDDARFDADVIDVAPQISGEIVKILVGEGDAVTQGQVLVVLDKRSLEAALAGNLCQCTRRWAVRKERDTLETAPSVSDSAKKPRRNGRKILVAVGFLVLLGLGVLAYWFFFLRGIVYSDDARFDADVIDVAPQINGEIVKILVGEGDAVTQGQVLVVLDKRALEAALAKSEAAVESAKATVAASQAEYDKAANGPRPQEIQIAEATERQLEAEAKLATAEWERTEKLYNEGATPKSVYDEARAKWQSALNAHEGATQRLALLREGTRTEDLAAARAKLELTKAELAKSEAEAQEARVDLDHTDVRSPCDGYIVRRWKDPGAIVAMGTPVLTVMDPSTLHVAANIKEKALDKIAIGDTVTISIDAYPGVRLTGRVTGILRATNSQFSLIPAEGVSGTYIKVAQRVPLRIAVEVPPGLAVGPGLSVEVSIHVSRGGSRRGTADGDE